MLVAAPVEAAGPRVCPSASVPVFAIVSADMSSCEVTSQNVEVDGFVVPIPPVNESVSLYALYDRSSRLLSVERSMRGLTITAEGSATDAVGLRTSRTRSDRWNWDKPYEAPSDELTVAGAPRACNDDLFRKAGYKELTCSTGGITPRNVATAGSETGTT